MFKAIKLGRLLKSAGTQRVLVALEIAHVYGSACAILLVETPFAIGMMLGWPERYFSLMWAGGICGIVSLTRLLMKICGAAVNIGWLTKAGLLIGSIAALGPGILFMTMGANPIPFFLVFSSGIFCIFVGWHWLVLIKRGFTMRYGFDGPPASP